MARQPRVDFGAAIHQVMSRGNDGIPIYRDDEDRTRFLALLAEEIVTASLAARPEPSATSESADFRTIVPSRRRTLGGVSATRDPYGAIDRSILQAIGLAMVNFSQLELGLRLALSSLLVGTIPDETPDLVSNKLSFKQLVDLFGCMYRHRYPEESRDEVDQLCGRLDGVNSRRNEMVHSLWSFGSTPTTLTRIHTRIRRKGHEVAQAQVAEGDVLRLALDVDAVHGSLMMLVMDIILTVDLRLPSRPAP